MACAPRKKNKNAKEATTQPAMPEAPAEVAETAGPTDPAPPGEPLTTLVFTYLSGRGWGPNLAEVAAGFLEQNGRPAMARDLRRRVAAGENPRRAAGRYMHLRPDPTWSARAPGAASALGNLSGREPTAACPMCGGKTRPIEQGVVVMCCDCAAHLTGRPSRAERAVNALSAQSLAASNLSAKAAAAPERDPAPDSITAAGARLWRSRGLNVGKDEPPPTPEPVSAAEARSIAGRLKGLLSAWNKRDRKDKP